MSYLKFGDFVPAGSGGRYRWGF